MLKSILQKDITVFIPSSYKLTVKRMYAPRLSASAVIENPNQSFHSYGLASTSAHWDMMVRIKISMTADMILSCSFMHAPFFLTYDIEFALLLAVLENSVLPMTAHTRPKK